MNPTADQAIVLYTSSTNDTTLTCDETLLDYPPTPETIQDADVPNVVYHDPTWTEWFEKDWILFPDLPEPLKQAKDPLEVGPSQCDTLNVLSGYGFLEEALRRAERYVQRDSMQRRLETGSGKTKRSPNAFILYRIAFRHVAEQVYFTKDQRLVSKICGESWFREPDQIRMWFHAQALVEKENQKKSCDVTKVGPSARKLMMSDGPHGERERSALEDEQHPIALIRR